MAKKKSSMTQSQATKVLKKAGAMTNKGNIVVTGDLRNYLRDNPKDAEVMQALRLKALKELETAERRFAVMERKAGNLEDKFLRRELIRKEQVYKERTEKLNKYLTQFENAKNSTTKAKNAMYTLGYLESVSSHREASYRISKSELSQGILAGIAAIVHNGEFFDIPHKDLERMIELSKILKVPISSQWESDYESYREKQLPSDSLIQDVYDFGSQFKAMYPEYGNDVADANELYDLLKKYNFL